MLIIFQILFIIFAIFAVSNVLARNKKGILGPKAVIFWIIFWILAVFVVFWPNSSSILAGYFGIGRGTDLVVYISLVLIFYLLFKLNIKLDSLDCDITKVVRKVALNQDNLKSKK